MKKMGILGGLGPLATVFFMNKIVTETPAESDQENIPMVVLNDTQIPDRTSYILDNTKENPLPKMIEDAVQLEQCGVDFIAMPCNTAHFFYTEIQRNIKIPMLNIIEETVKFAKEKKKMSKIGLLATDGTIITEGYQKMGEKYRVDIILPDENERKKTMELIYDKVKKGDFTNTDEMYTLVDNMKKRGAEGVILGCTELSIINEKQSVKRTDVVDSLDVLAKKSIEMSMS